MHDDNGESPLDLGRMLDDAVTEAVSHEDPERFMAWFREHVADYKTDAAADDLLDASFVGVLGRSIWNNLPLPGNGFRPRPLPEPGRNDPCFCGSGKKFKRCCANSPKLPLDPEHILPTVLDHTPADALARQIRAGRVPVAALVQAANQRFERGELWNTLDLLEPLFEDKIGGSSQAWGEALDLLCDVYVELGHELKKQALLERVVENAGRSPLRSDAWQRIAVTRLDEGDVDGAWQAFHHAQQDDPDGPGVGLLEIQILMSRGRVEEARERAGFWDKRLRRQGHGDDHPLVQFFAGIVADPREVITDMGIKAAGGAGARLIAWLNKVRERPLPDYDVEEVSLPEDDEAAPTSTLVLYPPEARRELESRWHAVFPLDKPAAVEEVPDTQGDPWDSTIEQTWMDFLDQHPESFDSLDIIDDLATALVLHPQYGAEWLDHEAVAPLLERARAIVEHALDGRGEPRLSWTLTENRPALRSLARCADLAVRREDTEAFDQAADRMLTLNPADHHGFRDRED